MTDSVKGSRTYAAALQIRFGRKPIIRSAGESAWECVGGCFVPGVGDSPEQAYVDHVEEFWALVGFPKDYPN